MSGVMSEFVKVFGCRPMMTARRTPGGRRQKMLEWSDLNVTFSPQHIAPHSATLPNIRNVSMSVSRPESNHRQKLIKYRFWKFCGSGQGHQGTV